MVDRIEHRPLINSIVDVDEECRAHRRVSSADCLWIRDDYHDCQCSASVQSNAALTVHVYIDGFIFTSTAPMYADTEQWHENIDEVTSSMTGSSRLNARQLATVTYALTTIVAKFKFAFTTMMGR